MIRALLVDDEPLGRRRIRKLLEDEPDVAVVGMCANGQEAVEAIQAEAPDLVFLDVQMPVLDGFAVLDAVGAEHMPVVIFVTAYDQYALRAFDVHALDYLLKPFDRERFQEALDRARLHLQRRSLDAMRDRLSALLDAYERNQTDAPTFLTRIPIKTAGRVYFLNVEEIDWIEAAGNYVNLHAGRKTHLLRETMNGLEAQLDPQRFLRIHRSVMVHQQRIASLKPLLSGSYEVHLQDGTRLQASRSYRDRIRALLHEG